MIGLVDVTANGPALVSELTETFARVYLANARDFLTSIVFVHGVTSIAAVRSLLPHLDEATVRAALATPGSPAPRSTPPSARSRRRRSRSSRRARRSTRSPDMAIANGDEHAIKFTERAFGSTP